MELCSARMYNDIMYNGLIICNIFINNIFNYSNPLFIHCHCNNYCKHYSSHSVFHKYTFDRTSEQEVVSVPLPVNNNILVMIFC